MSEVIHPPSGPMNGTALGSAVPVPKPAHKIWRVKLLAQELVDAGFFPEMLDPWTRLFKPMLLAKGLPEGFTLDRTPARIAPMVDEKTGELTGIMLEFE